MTDLQHAVQDAQTRADALARARDQLHRETLNALGRHDAAAFAAAEKREAETAIGDLQSTTALRRARQDLTEAVNDAVEQGEALERAAVRAAAGEVAPSVRDLLACDGPDCAPVSKREHAALIVIGAVGPGFDANQWPPDNAPSPISILAYAPNALPLFSLRRFAADASQRAQATAAEAEAAHARLNNNPADQTTLAAYATARGAADAAQAERLAAQAHVQQVIDGYAKAGRALKRAGLLAGDGYALKRDGRRVCNPNGCLAAEGLEAAAFLVIGAAEDMNGGLKRFGAFVTSAADGRAVFR